MNNKKIEENKTGSKGKNKKRDVIAPYPLEPTDIPKEILDNAVMDVLKKKG